MHLLSEDIVLSAKENERGYKVLDREEGDVLQLKCHSPPSLAPYTPLILLSTNTLCTFIHILFIICLLHQFVKVHESKFYFSSFVHLCISASRTATSTYSHSITIS